MTKGEAVMKPQTLNQDTGHPTDTKPSVSNEEDSTSSRDFSLLEKKLEKYKDLFEHAPIGILQSTLDGQVISANKAIAQIMGFDSPEDYIASIDNLAYDAYVDPAQRGRLIDLCITQSQVLNFHTEFRRKDNKTITCNINLHTARNKDGSISHFDSFIEDITKQQKMAEAVRESEAHYRSIFENTGAGTIIIEADTTISFANSGFEKLTGYSKAEIEGQMKWPTIVAYPAELEMMLNYHYTRRKTKTLAPIEYEFTVISKDNRKKTVFIRVDMITGTNRSVASLVDLTSLREAERSFRESESKLSGILEAFEGSVYICSKDYQISYMNRTLKDIVGEVNNGSLCYQKIYGLDKPCGWCAHNRIFTGESVKVEFQDPKTGRWLYALNTPIFASDNTVSRKQTVILDIHERKMAEDAIREQEQYLQQENVRLRKTIQDRYKFGQIIGKSLPMQRVYELILRAASSNANVIIYGESGTGKELVAKAIHDLSDRSAHPFVPVNCGAIPSHLAESEFFGYKRGAFTGALTDKPGYLEKADRGSLFLDELGEVSTDMQVKLLRVLSDGGYTPVGSVDIRHPDIRIIAATNRDIKALLRQGQIREDFFYRIHIIPIQLPPLRDRKEDIPLLAEYFLKKYKKDNQPVKLNGKIMDTLFAHDWPGNVRELENSIQRLINLGDLDFVETPTSLQPYYNPASTDNREDFYNLPLKQAVVDFEKHYISHLLDRFKWNRTQVAKHLGIERKTLYLKMKNAGLQ